MGVYLPILSGCYWLAVPYGMFLKICGQKKSFVYRLLAMIAMETHQNLGQSFAEGEQGPTADTHSGLQSFHQPSASAMHVFIGPRF